MMQDRFRCRAWSIDKATGKHKMLYDIPQPNTTWVDGRTVLKVMQCTGLKDSEGELIWERDIVCGILRNIDYYLVIWDTEYARFRLLGKQDFDIVDNSGEWRDIYEVGVMNWFDMRIIGNQYENPELLDEDKWEADR